MSYLGNIKLGDTLDFKFCTVQATGAPTTLAGSPVLSAYPNNSTTQITAGITLSVDFDSVTGLNNCRVVASNGNGYATATNYDIVITTGTVNSVSVVGYVVGSFSIENRTPSAADITTAVFAHAFASAYGSYTFEQVMDIILATQAAKTSGGATTTFTIRNIADSANVIVATVDADGNRSAVTITP